MKKYILIQSLLILFFGISLASAAPNVDGYMQYTLASDWKNLGTGVTNFRSGFNDRTDLTNVSVEYGYSSDTDNSYDLQELGMYIDNTTLYIGIQTEYNLKSGQDRTEPGDFIFSFDKADTAGNIDKTFADNGGTPDFAFSFDIHRSGNVDFTLLMGDLGGAKPTDLNPYDTDWEITSSEYSSEFKDAGLYTRSRGENTIEAKIDLATKSDAAIDKLMELLASNTSMTMYWQPSCGNDFLAVRTDIPHPEGGGSPVPEPATLVLFGMGLLGAGALGRRRQKSI